MYRHLSSALLAVVVLGGATAPCHAQGAKKLDHRQQKDLKDAQGYLNDVDGILTKLSEYLAQTKSGDEVSANVYAQVEAAIGNLANARQRLTNVKNRTDKLPADHEEVRAAVERATRCSTDLAAAETKLTELKTQLDQIRDPARYPQFDADVAKVDALAAQLARTSALRDRPEEAVETIAQWSSIGPFINGCVATYKPLIRQETPQGNKMLAKLKHFQSQNIEFIRAAFKFFDEGAREADQEIDGAVRMADDAVVNKKPAFFAGGVAQKLEAAAARLVVLEALGAPNTVALLKDRTKNTPNAAAHIDECAKNTATLSAKLTQARARIAKQAGTLEKDIVEANTLPADGYAGADEAELLAKAKERWLADHGSDEIKAAVIAAADWKRNDNWKWNGATQEWVHYDSSSITVLLAVKTDDATATLYCVWFSKDHLSGDALRITTEKREPQPPQRRLLLANIK